MGKKRPNSAKSEHEVKKSVKTEESIAKELVDDQNSKDKVIAKSLKSVKLPTTADGLTAEQLTSEQKMVFKKQCQHMYGHKFSTKRKLPANSIESATLQLAAKMKEKQKQLKQMKKGQKTN